MKEFLREVLETLGHKEVAPTIAGILGGFVAYMLGEEKSVTRAAVSITVGGITATYAGPWLGEVFFNSGLIGLAGFIAGLLGMRAIQFAFAVLSVLNQNSTTITKAFISILKNKFK